MFTNIITVINKCIGRGLRCWSKIPSGSMKYYVSCSIPSRLCGQHAHSIGTIFENEKCL